MKEQGHEFYSHFMVMTATRCQFQTSVLCQDGSK